MRLALIEAGMIANVVEAESVFWATQHLGGEWIELPAGAGIGWGADGSPPESPAPELRLRLSVREFREQFTQAEKQAIYTAAKSSVDVEVWLDDLRSVSYVDLDFPQTIASVQALEDAGLIGEGRADEILAGVTDGL